MVERHLAKVDTAVQFRSSALAKDLKRSFFFVCGIVFVIKSGKMVYNSKN